MLERHLEKLAGFHAAARAGKLSAAARERGLTQPALTRSLQALEGAVGAPLFERHRRGIVLTTAGQQLYEYCQRLFPEVADLEERLRAPNELAGVLTIGTYETLGISFWPGALRRLRKLYPRLVVQISTESAESLWRRLEIGALDLIVDAEPPIAEHLYSRVLYQDSFALYRGGRYRGALPGAAPVPFSYVRRATDPDGATIEEHLARLKVPHRLLYSFDSFVSVRAAVLEGLALGVLPTSLAEADARAGRLVALKGYPRFAPHRICATCLEARRKEKKVAELMALLRESVAAPAT